MNTILLISAVLILFFGFQKYQMWKMQKNRGNPAPALSGQYGDAIDSGKASLFYFHSPSCGACRSMTPVISEFTGGGSRCFSVNVAQEMSVAQAFGVMGTPSTVIVENGIIRDFLVGPRPQSELQKLLTEVRA